MPLADGGSVLGPAPGDGGVAAQVRSAGSRATGRPVRPEVAAVASERGLDLADHTSRLLDAQLGGEADLVLGMAREHVREAVALAPEAWNTAFTLKELIRRGRARPRTDEALAAWLADLGGGREIHELLGDAAEDDIEDPVSRPLAVVRETALSSLPARRDRGHGLERRRSCARADGDVDQVTHLGLERGEIDDLLRGRGRLREVDGDGV